MHFRYLDNDRLQLWFISPNYCAAFICMVLLLWIGIYCTLHAKKVYSPWSVLFAGSIIWGEYLLAVTYSRGGYIAFAVGLGVAWLLTKRKVPILFLGCFLIVLLLIPDGGVRLESIGALQEGSIRNRLLLWLGGICLLGSYPFGLGADAQIGEYYTMLYQPLWLNEQYFEFVNDILSFSVRYGLIALFAVTAAIFWIVAEAVVLQKRKRWSYFPFVIATVAAYLVLGLFTTFYFVKQLAMIWVFALLVLSGSILWGWWTGEHKFLWRRSLAVCIIAMFFCLSFFIGGNVLQYSNRSYVFSSDPMTFANNNKIKRGTLLTESKGQIICVLPSEPSPFPNAIRTIMRPVLDAGYDVAVLAIPTDASGIDTFQKQFSAIGQKTFADKQNLLYAEKAAARIAFIGLADQPQLAVPLDYALFFGLEESWPWPELSPIDRASEFPLSAMFVDCISDVSYDPERYSKFLATSSARGIAFESVTIHDSNIHHPMESEWFLAEVVGQIMRKQK